MLKSIAGLFIVMSVNSYFITEWDAREAKLQVARSHEQEILLTNMEAIKNPAVSRLADDWRKAHSEPDEDELTKLRDMVQHVKANPEWAAKLTMEAKQSVLDKFRGFVSRLL